VLNRTKGFLVFATAGLILLTAFIYLRVLSFPAISWDDPEMVFKNNDVRHFNISAFFTSHYVGNYIPLTMCAHALLWVISGIDAGGHHGLNLALHLVNGILVFFAGRKLFALPLIAFTGAAIFLLHPLQVESVAWIAELKNILYTTWFLGGLLSYLRFRENKRKEWYWLAFLFFILSCLSKPSAVVFPLVLVLADLLKRESFWPALRNKMPMLVIAIIFGVINLRTQQADQFINYSHMFPVLKRVLLAGYALAVYLAKFVVPVQLSVIYPYPAAGPGELVAGFVFILLLTASVYVLYKREKYVYCFLIFFVLINLALVLQLLPFGEVLYADRYMYLPLAGLGWMMGALISRGGKVVVVTGSVVVIGFACATYVRVDKWRNALALYEDIIKKYPDNFVALNSLGVEYMYRNSDQKALQYFSRAIQASPLNYKGLYNRGLLHLKTNKPDAAIDDLNRSLAIYDYAKARAARASAFMLKGECDKAQADAQRVLSADVMNIKAHFVLATCFNTQNNLDSAEVHFTKCIKLNGEDETAYFGRGIVFGKRGLFKESAADMTEVLRINPIFYEAYYWRAVSSINLGQDPCRDLEIAARNRIEPAIHALNKYCK
jgi:protein O-mannosyl-transferase